MSWISSNLINTVSTWNNKFSEIVGLLLMPPEMFNNGGVWNVIVNINGAMQAIALALLVLFFVIGVMKTCGNFAEIKRPEQALKLFIRFAIAKGIITYGMELLTAIIRIVQGVASSAYFARDGAFQIAKIPVLQEMELFKLLKYLMEFSMQLKHVAFGIRFHLEQLQY